MSIDDEAPSQSKGPQWVSRKRDFEQEKRALASGRRLIIAQTHPLIEGGGPASGSLDAKKKKGQSANKSSSAVGGGGGSDIGGETKRSLLGLAESDDSSDILSGTSQATQQASVVVSSPGSNAGKAAASKILDALDSAEPNVGKDTDSAVAMLTWESRRQDILAKYTTSEKLTISTSFLSAKAVNREKTYLEKLEELDEPDEDGPLSASESLNISQQEYVARINELHGELSEAWSKEERVRSIKIMVQCSKLLADVSVPQFYPSKFVLISEIMDLFGNLVYDRLLSRCISTATPTQAAMFSNGTFTPAQVNDDARETCKNWFFKISSIRELISRYYLETAILKSSRFLQTEFPIKQIKRLLKTTRGFGDPLVAIYARAYLARTVHQLFPDRAEVLRDMIGDIIVSFPLFSEANAFQLLMKSSLAFSGYLDLIKPASDWIFSVVVPRLPKDLLHPVLDGFKKHCNNSVVLSSILQTFPVGFISENVLSTIQLIRECNCVGLTQLQLINVFGMALGRWPPKKELFLTVMNEVWKMVTKITDPSEYIKTADIYVELAAKFLSAKELNVLVGDIVRHVSVNNFHEKLFPQLESVTLKLVRSASDISSLFGMSNFLELLDLFQNFVGKLQLGKLILDEYTRRADVTGDVVIVNTAMYVCKLISDTINSSTYEDDRRQVSNLAILLIQKVDFGRDLEKQLEFFVQVRSSFPDFDSVLKFVIQRACILINRTYRIVKGNHTKKTASFVRAAVAFCFITIPSISDAFSRLNLYLLCGQQAVMNDCLLQADALFKATISQIPELGPFQGSEAEAVAAEANLASFLISFASTLLTVPGHPEQGPFYLLNGFLNVIRSFPWRSNSESLGALYTNILALLSTLRQERMPYGYPNVDSNDELYSGETRYFAEIDVIASKILEDCLLFVQNWSDATESGKRVRALIVNDLLNRVLVYGDLNNADMSQLAVNLFGLSRKIGGNLTPFAKNTVQFLRNRGGSEYQELCARLASK